MQKKTIKNIKMFWIRRSPLEVILNVYSYNIFKVFLMLDHLG